MRARVKDFLAVRFTDEKLTSYGRLEPLGRFLRTSGFLDRLKEVFSARNFDTDYGSFRMALALIGMAIIGGTLLRPLRALGRAPLLLLLQCQGVPLGAASKGLLIGPDLSLQLIQVVFPACISSHSVALNLNSVVAAAIALRKQLTES